MSMFQLDWFRCSDGYRIEDGRPWVHDDVEPHIFPNSEHWWPTRPLDTPGLYRQLADCDPSAEGVLEFVNRHGFLSAPKPHAEPTQVGFSAITAMRALIGVIDTQNWTVLSIGLNHVMDDEPSYGGLGQLGVILETPPDSDRPILSRSNLPILKLRPVDLVSALEMQALEDASLGINLRNCKSPECPEYLGSTSHRAQAEYCSKKCQGRHAYLKRKATKQ